MNAYIDLLQLKSNKNKKQSNISELTICGIEMKCLIRMLHWLSMTDEFNLIYDRMVSAQGPLAFFPHLSASHGHL